MNHQILVPKNKNLIDERAEEWANTKFGGRNSNGEYSQRTWGHIAEDIFKENYGLDLPNIKDKADNGYDLVLNTKEKKYYTGEVMNPDDIKIDIKNCMGSLYGKTGLWRINASDLKEDTVYLLTKTNKHITDLKVAVCGIVMGDDVWNMVLDGRATMYKKGEHMAIYERMYSKRNKGEHKDYICTEDCYIINYNSIYSNLPDGDQASVMTAVGCYNLVKEAINALV